MFEVYQIKKSIPTLKRWWKRFNTSDWDFRDASQRPSKIHYKFDEETKKLVVELRKRCGYSAKQLRIKLNEMEIFIQYCCAINFTLLRNFLMMNGIKFFFTEITAVNRIGNKFFIFKSLSSYYFVPYSQSLCDCLSCLQFLLRKNGGICSNRKQFIFWKH